MKAFSDEGKLRIWQQHKCSTGNDKVLHTEEKWHQMEI